MISRRTLLRTAAAGLLVPAAVARPGIIGLSGPRLFVPAAAAESQLDDWNARISAPGVLWAQRFNSTDDINRWSNTASGNPAPTLESGGIIPGDGCMRQTVPAGTGVAGARMWSRPIQPQPGDINEPGVTTGAGGTWIQSWNSANHGYISAYENANRSRYVLGSELYFQFRVRFSSNRFDSGTAASKMLYLSCNYNDPSQELILRGKGSAPAGVDRAFSVYTNFDGPPNGALGHPQGASPGTTEQRQPTGFPGCTYNTPDSCYKYDAGIWHTVLVRFRPGHHDEDDTLLAIYCQKPGDSEYTLVHYKDDYVWLFDDSSQAGTDGSRHGYGICYISFNPFTGGGSWAANGAEWYHEFDQVICSLEPIACPAVFGI